MILILSLAHPEVHTAGKTMTLGPSSHSWLRKTKLTHALLSQLTSVPDTESYHLQTNTKLYLFLDTLKKIIL